MKNLGSRDDDLDLPTKSDIPTVNNAQITLTQGGTTKGSFTLNQSGSATIDLDAGGSTEIKTLNTTNTTAQTTSASEDLSGSGTVNLHKVSKTGSYNDLNDKPTIPTDTGATSVTTSGTGNAVTTASYDSSTRKITLTKGTTFLTSAKTLNTTNTTAQTTSSSEAISGSGTINLHKVAKTGSYSDLLNKPTIPTKTSQLTNDSGYTTNTGTITGVTMNGASKGTSGVVDLGTVITAHQDISGKANVDASNLSSSNINSWNTVLDNAKLLANMETTSSGDIEISGLNIVAGEKLYVDLEGEYQSSTGADMYMRFNDNSGNIYSFGGLACNNTSGGSVNGVQSLSTSGINICYMQYQNRFAIHLDFRVKSDCIEGQYFGLFCYCTRLGYFRGNTSAPLTKIKFSLANSVTVPSGIHIKVYKSL